MENAAILAELQATRRLLEAVLLQKANTEYDLPAQHSEEPRMATLSRLQSGLCMVRFQDRHGRRRTLRLGRMPEDAAQTICDHVSNLVTASVTGTALDKKTVAWLVDVGDQMAARLSGLGLIAQRAPGRLGEFADRLTAKYKDAKPRTRANLEGATEKLVEFFGHDRRITDITPEAAEDWVRSLRTAEYSKAYIARLIKYAKQLFNAARKAKLIEQGPFDEIKAGGMANPGRQRFITPEEIDLVLKACNSPEWRLIVVLARYAGMRCPSELMTLRWEHVDWDRGRFLVHAPKTEHHENGGRRWTPLFPEVREALQHAATCRNMPQHAKEGYVLPRKTGHEWNLRQSFEQIIYRAGLIPWPRLFQNLRSSRETELLQRFPVHVVCSWLGNTPSVALRHYAQVTDADFAAALLLRSDALRKANPRSDEKVEELAGNAAFSDDQYAPQESGAAAEDPDVIKFAPRLDSGAPELQTIISSWPYLAASVRETILEIVRISPRQSA